MLNQATKQNLIRKAHWADAVQLLPDGTPLFSWCDIDPVDLCNRSCVFCPRSDPTVAPNNKLYMSQRLADKIASELYYLDYKGAVIFCGTGEPLLHPNFVELIRPFMGLHVEMVTNGDRLTPKLISDLYASGMSFINVSCYDGPHQLDKFHAMFDGLADASMYQLRDRWYSADEDFGVKLTNRAGTIQAGHQPAVDTQSPCQYPSYAATISWNGDFLLCPQDFARRQRYGNLNDQTLVEIWTSRAYHKRRMRLLNKREGLSPCGSCNCDGQIHGADHAKLWQGDKT